MSDSVASYGGFFYVVHRFRSISCSHVGHNPYSKPRLQLHALLFVYLHLGICSKYVAAQTLNGPQAGWNIFPT